MKLSKCRLLSAENVMSIISTRTIYHSFQRFEASENRILLLLLLLLFFCYENLIYLVINNKLALYFICTNSPLSMLLNVFSCLYIDSYIIIIINLLHKSFSIKSWGLSPLISMRITLLDWFIFFPQIFS